jgi:hypothetical protein
MNELTPEEQSALDLFNRTHVWNSETGTYDYVVTEKHLQQILEMYPYDLGDEDNGE